jgi:TP901 family phage tail tape measure protein
MAREKDNRLEGVLDANALIDAVMKEGSALNKNTKEHQKNQQAVKDSAKTSSDFAEIKDKTTARIVEEKNILSKTTKTIESYNVSMGKTITTTKKIKDGNKELVQNIKTTVTNYDKANASLQKQIEKVEKYMNTISRARGNVTGFNGPSDIKEQTEATIANADTLTNRYMELNMQLAKTKGVGTEAYDSIRKEMDALVPQIGQATRAVNESNAALNSQKGLADRIHYSWKKAFTSFSMYMSVTTVFYSTIRTIQSMIQEVTNLDTALTELQKVTDLQGNSLEEFTDKAFKAGEGLAKTGQEVIEASTEFAKAGYGTDESLELGKIALMYTNIADEAVNASDSASFLIAQMKAFNIEATDSEHIIDAVNEVANKYAVSSSDIANNLGASSAVLANANVSFEESLGLLTAGTEITRNASKVSNGLKTITLRLQGMNDEGEEDLELIPKLQGAFNKLGLTLTDSNGNLKSTFEILKELAPVYQTMTNDQKAWITEIIAGKFQAQNAAAILTNFSTAINATATAMDSAGSATRENDKVLNSIQGRMKAFTTAFQDLSNSLIKSDLVKFIINLGTALLKFADSPVGNFIITTTAATVAFSGLQFAIGKFTTSKFLKDIVSSTTALKAYTPTALKAAYANGTLGTSLKALGKSLLASPLFWVVLITSVAEFISNIETAQQRTSRLYDEATEKYEQAKSELDSNNEELGKVGNKIDELNAKDKLTFVEKDELAQLKLTNEELKNQNDILKENEKLKKSEQIKAANKKALTELNEDFVGDYYSDGKEPNLLAKILLGANATRESYGTQDEYIDSIIKKYKKLDDTAKASSSEYKLLSERLNKYNGDLANLSGEAYERTLAIRDNILKVLQPDTFRSTKFTDFFKQDDNRELYTLMDDISKIGNLTTGTIDELKKDYPEIDKLLKDAGLSANDLAEYFNKVREAGESSVSGLLDSYSQYEDSIAKLKDAQAEFNDQGFITASTFKDLYDSDLLQYLDFTADGLKINTQALQDDASAAKQSMIESIKLSAAKQILALSTKSTDDATKDSKKTAEDYTGTLSEQQKANADTIASNLGLAASNELVANSLKGVSGFDEETYNANKAKIDKIIADTGTVISKMNHIGVDLNKGGSKDTKTWWEKQLDALKQQFDYSEITLQEYINGLSNLLSKLKQGSDEWKQVNDLLQQQKLSKVEEDYKLGTLSLEQYINSLKSLIATYKQGTDAWNDLADKIKQANEELLNNRKDDYDKAYNAAIKLIDDEIDKVQDLRDEKEKYYNDQIEALQKTNDETERQIELTQLQQNLVNAQNEKNKRVWHEGLGWVWEADQQAIADAQKALTDFQNNQAIQELEDERDTELSILDDKLKNWQDYKDSWSDIQSTFEDTQNRLMLQQQMGADFETQVLNGRLDALEQFKNKYVSLQQEILNATNAPIGSGIPTVSSPAPVSSSASQTYTVRAGDTLSAIGAKFGIA